MLSWSEKFNDPALPEVRPAPPHLAGAKPGDLMLLPTPRIVDAYIRTIPRGTSMDVRTLRTRLAHEHGADDTCPAAIGKHLRTVAEVAWEEYLRGVPPDDLTPVWRVLNEKSATTKWLSGGPEFILDRRAAEGI